jgi:hypothetical protein
MVCHKFAELVKRVLEKHGDPYTSAYELVLLGYACKRRRKNIKNQIIQHLCARIYLMPFVNASAGTRFIQWFRLMDS